MNQRFMEELAKNLAQLKAEGFEKPERVIVTPQDTSIQLEDGSRVINFCANNYLGLADDPRLVAAAEKGLKEYALGCASVRFICGTMEVHKKLEKVIAKWLKTDDSILFSSCFDANGGVFESLLNDQDAIISDELNHASIIDGVRLCKAKRFRYKNNNMGDLESQLKAADEAGIRFKLIVTDGVFSMDGIIADLKGICKLAETYNALVMVDDSHAAGFIGATGAGTPEYCGVQDKIDIYTGTLGKALGGASGGYVAARQPIVDTLRQKARPYLFSNSLVPALAESAIEAIRIVTSSEGNAMRKRIQENSQLFRSKMSAFGFTLVPGEHPIIPVMLGDARLASQMADALLKEGIYVIGFSYPVVPKGKARIRTQMSAKHTPEQIERTVDIFAKIGRKLGVIK